MMKTIVLHGDLGATFGREARIDVASPAEAIRALAILKPGFRQHIETGAYRVFRGDPALGRDHDADELDLRLPDHDAEIHIVPHVSGAKDDGIGKVILGAALVGASFAIPGSAMILGKSAAGMVGQLGASMLLGGVSMLLTPRPDAGGGQERESSDLFSGSYNRSDPGGARPVVFGECEVPIVIVSAAIHVEDRV